MRSFCFHSVFALTLVTAMIGPYRLCADEAASSASRFAIDVNAKANSIEQLERFVTALALAYIPHTYEDLDDWGKQSQRWDGLKVHLDGLRIKTKRRKKSVNHGTWKKYQVSLHKPHKKAFQIHLANLTKTDNGTVAFDIRITAPLHVHGRVAKWIKGVQLFSVSADAIARVQLAARVEVNFFLNVAEFPPAITLSPEVKQADVALIDFQMYRVSDIGGEIAQQIGRGAESVIRKRLAKERPKLADKLNKTLKKEQDKLRISPQDLLTSKWGKFAKEHLPAANGSNRDAEDLAE